MFKMKKKTGLVMAALLGVSLLLTACVGGGDKKAAVKFPTKPINLVVPYAAGGSSDLSARPYADAMAGIIGQPMVVVNKPGAGGAIGAADVARQKPDGYNLLGASIGNVTIAPFTANVGYDNNSFTPIAQMTDIPLCIAVPADSPIKDLKGFVEYAKANPGKIRYGNPGAGNIQHVTMEGWAKKVGIKLTPMPFEGANPAIAALLGKHVEATCTGVTEAAPHVKSGALRVLGVTSAKRIEMMPNAPTFKEQGFDTEAGVWYGVIGPKGMDPAVVKVLAEGLKKAYEDKKTQDAWAKLFLIPAYLGPEDFAKRIQKEATENKQVLEDIGLAKKK